MEIKKYSFDWLAEYFFSGDLNHESQAQIFHSQPEQCSNEECITHAKDNANDNPEAMNNLEKDSKMTMRTCKIITASTEDAFMPLLQLSTLFPKFIALFHTKISLDHFKTEATDKILNVKTLEHYWGFTIAIFSIFTSLVSIGKAIT